MGPDKFFNGTAVFKHIGNACNRQAVKYCNTMPLKCLPHIICCTISQQDFTNAHQCYAGAYDWFRCGWWRVGSYLLCWRIDLRFIVSRLGDIGADVRVGQSRLCDFRVESRFIQVFW